MLHQTTISSQQRNQSTPRGLPPLPTRKPEFPLTEGQAFAGLEHGKRVSLTAGDIVIFLHGDSHIIGNGARVELVDQERELHRIFTQGLKLARGGGGGEVTRFVCGYMSCDPQLSRVFLAGLPAILEVNVRDSAAGRWLEDSIRFSVEEADASRAGGEAVMAKLSEVLFVETANLLSLGRSPIWRARSDCHVPFWPSASDII